MIPPKFTLGDQWVCWGSLQRRGATYRTMDASSQKATVRRSNDGFPITAQVEPHCPALFLSLLQPLSGPHSVRAKLTHSRWLGAAGYLDESLKGISGGLHHTGHLVASPVPVPLGCGRFLLNMPKAVLSVTGYLALGLLSSPLPGVL